MPRLRGKALLPLLAAWLLGRPCVRADPVVAPVAGKTRVNTATGGTATWDFSGADIAFKAQRGELWVLDPYSQPLPFINAFSLQNISALPRRITIRLPAELKGATVLGLAEIPRGDFAGKNLVLVDRAFSFPNLPEPLFGVLEDDGTPLAGSWFVPPWDLDRGARLTAIDINPERDEIAAYDVAGRSFYLLDFNFSVVAGPIPLLGFPSFLATPWLLGTQLEGNGGGLAYLGPDAVLAPAGLLNGFETHLLVEYDLLEEGRPSGRALDLSAAPAGGADLVFGPIDTGQLGAKDVAFAVNSGDDTVYAFELLPGDGPPLVESIRCSLRDGGQYELRWSLADPAAMSTVHVLENGVDVASVDARAGSYRSPLPLLGSALLEAATGTGGTVGPVRLACQVQPSPPPRFPGVSTDSVRVDAVGDLAGVAVTRFPASREDFRGYLLGLSSNAVLVFDHRLQAVEALPLSPLVLTQGQNLAAIGIAILRLGGEDHLALLDPDGPAGLGPPGASIHYLEGARRGQLRQRITAIDLSALNPQPFLLGWDSDQGGGFVASGALPGTGNFAVVRIRFDGTKMWATEMIPLPHRALTPFTDRPLAGMGVTVLPSGNILVAGSDVFARSYTEALLLTPFSDDPGRSARLVGYAQGLPAPEHIRSKFGLGVGPSLFFGLAAAYFPPEPGAPAGVGVTYLPVPWLNIIKNAAGVELSIPANLLVHGENGCSHPDLKAEQLDEESLQAPPGESVESRLSSPSFREAASIDFFFYVLNESTTQSARLAVEPVLGGSSVPEGSASVLLPPGRYFRRVLPSRREKDLQVRLRNQGADTARLRVITGAMAVPTPAGSPFKRGDCDRDGTVGLTDAVFGLTYQFLAGERPACPDACDSDDSGAVNVSDMVLILAYLFTAGEAPSPPGPLSCGPDPTGDDPLDPCGGPLGCP